MLFYEPGLAPRIARSVAFSHMLQKGGHLHLARSFDAVQHYLMGLGDGQEIDVILYDDDVQKHGHYYGLLWLRKDGKGNPPPSWVVTAFPQLKDHRVFMHGGLAYHGPLEVPDEPEKPRTLCGWSVNT